jgi:hypothetical protein
MLLAEEYRSFSYQAPRAPLPQDRDGYLAMDHTVCVCWIFQVKE